MPTENLIEIHEGNFAAETAAGTLPILIDFGAAWCAPCRTIEPHVRALAGAYAGRVRVAKCDADGNNKLTAELDVRSLPTLMLFKDGRVVGQLVGAAPRARIEALLAKALPQAA